MDGPHVSGGESTGFIPAECRSAQDRRLRRFERLALWGLFAGLIVFGAVVELRGAFLKRRYTDLAVFLRAAWAVQTGRDIYSTIEERGLHFHYPPLLAILLAPLADPPIGSGEPGYVPFAVSVALWYCLSVGCIAFGAHRLASALEARAAEWGRPPPARWSRSWWALRVIPCVACLPATAHGLSLGQVTPLLLLLCCSTAAALLRRRSFEAGAWLAGAICLKLIPFFLLFYPLWRRDRRMLVGCVAGVLLGGVAVPAAVLGPARAASYYREWVEALVLPGLGLAEGSDRAEELLNVTATQSQSPLGVMHHTLHAGDPHPPVEPAPGVRLAHWTIGGGLTLLTLAAAGRRGGARDGTAEVLLFGALIADMLLLSPVCHQHYLTLLVPLAMGLLAAAGSAPRPLLRPRTAQWLLAANAVASLAPFIPGCKVLHFLGLAMYAELALLLTAAIALRRNARAERSLSSRVEAAAKSIGHEADSRKAA
jgi:alpha-1,2-mannosyltransferase